MAYDAWVAHTEDDPAVLVALEGQLEQRLEFAQGRVEIRRHALCERIENISVTRDDVYSINMALSRRPTPTTITHLGLGGSDAPQEMGRIVLVPPASRLRVSTPAGRSRCMHFALNADVIDNLLRGKPQWSERRFREAARVDSQELEWLLLKIYRELSHEAFGGEVVVESLVTAVCVELIRRFQLGEAEVLRPRKGGLAPWRMRLLRDRIHAPGPAPSLTELAEICGLTVRQLSRGYKAETGQTIGKFVEMAMLERARALLAETDLSIAEIATELGFSHAASFTFAFRRATGLNPSEVEGRRRKLRRPANKEIRPIPELRT